MGETNTSIPKSISVDNVTLQTVGGVTSIKDGGVDTDQLAANGITAAKLEANLLPKGTIWIEPGGDETFIVDSGTFTERSPDNNQAFGGAYTQAISTPAIGNKFSVTKYLQAITYQVYVYYVQDPSFGIGKLTIDGTDTTTFDMYAASTAYNAKSDLGTVTIATAGDKTISYETTGKTGSNYSTGVSGILLVPQA